MSRSEALHLVENLHWPIFPCNPLDKRPLVENGFKAATTDPKQIAKWWRRWPNAMIGVPTGEVSGFFCVDQDRKEEGKDGVATWDAWTIEYREVILTRAHTTPSTGRHALFQMVAGIRNIPLDRLGPGIEIKGDGGYIVVPPSKMHDGREYVGNDIPVAPAPKWLIDKIFRYYQHRNEKEEKREQHEPVDIDLVRYALSLISDDSYQAWFEIGGALRGAFSKDPEEGYKLFSEWSGKSKKFDPTQCRDKWSKLSAVREFTVATIFWHAEKVDKDWLTKYNQATKTQKEPMLRSLAYAIIDEQAIPTRPWIIPGLLMRGHLSLMAAPGGTGKSVLTICVAIALATGKPWANWKPRKQCKVLLINSEEDMDEMQRRTIAAAVKMGVNLGEIKDNLHVPNVSEMIIAEYDKRTRDMIVTPRVDNLIKLIKREVFDVVIVDPFTETFRGEETNLELKWVGAEWRKIARITSSGIWLVHHTRKYSKDMAGDVDAARGGTALPNIVRVATTLFPMTEKEATIYGIKIEERHMYVRHDDAKTNYDSPSGMARWFRMDTVILQNQHDDIPGDNVGVPMPWKPPMEIGIAPDKIMGLIAKIDRGIYDADGVFTGEYYTWNKNQTAGDSFNRWVGRLVCKELGCNELQAMKIINDLRNRNELMQFEYKNSASKNRHPRRACGSPAKTAAMEAPPKTQGKMDL